MKDGTPLARAASRLRRAWTTLDHVLFRSLDLDATARGWEVHGTGSGRRVYRDPRWHSVSVCAECGGSGLAAARSCPECAGRGTVRLGDTGVSAATTSTGAVRPAGGAVPR